MITIAKCDKCGKSSIIISCRKCNRNFCFDCFHGEEYKLVRFICYDCEVKNKNNKKGDGHDEF